MEQVVNPTKPSIVLFSNTARSLLQFRGALMRDLIEQGYDVFAVAKPDGAEKGINELGAKFISLDISRSGISPLHEVRMMIRLFSLLRSISPALMVSYTIKPNTYGPVIARMLGIPVIAVVTGLGYAYINQTIVAKTARVLLRMGLMKANHIWFLNQDDIGIVCGKSRKLIGKSSLLPGEGIDTSFYSPSPIEPGYEKKFLMITRLLADKGVREFIEAAKIVRGCDPDALFILLGPADNGNPAALPENEITEAVQQEHIVYHGTVQDVRPFIRDAACVVLPSYREGIARVLLEAGAMAKPLIVTDVPGCRDVIIPEKTGFLCAPRDPESLSQACFKFLSLSAVKRSEMGRASRENVAAKFDQSVILAMYREKMKELGL